MVKRKRCCRGPGALHGCLPSPALTQPPCAWARPHPQDTPIPRATEVPATATNPLPGSCVATVQQPIILHPESRATNEEYSLHHVAAHCFYYSCGSVLPFTTQVPSRTPQPSGAAGWEADSGLCEEASYLLKNCLCGILTIWKEYGNETFTEMELLS